MREVASAATILAMLGTFGTAHAARWVGPGNTTGPVEQPGLYLQAVAPLALERNTFDHLGPGTDVNRHSLGSFGLLTTSAEDSIVARTGPVAGAEPASPTIALLVSGPSSHAAELNFVMTDPVISVAFVLMGLESSAYLKVYGANDSIIGDYVIPAGLPGERRWIGIAEDDRNIFSVRLQPTTTGRDYAIDDVELGVHAPEPATLVLAACIAVALPARIRKSNRQRGWA